MNKQEAIERMAETAYTKPISEHRLADMEAALDALIEYLPEVNIAENNDPLACELMVQKQAGIYQQLKSWGKNE